MLTRRLVAIALWLGGLAAMSGRPALAQTFHVGCSAAALSSAVGTANSNGQNDLIYLKPSCTYGLASDLQVLADSGHMLTVYVKPTATLRTNGNAGVFCVEPAANLKLQNVTISGDGYATQSGCGPFDSASALYNNHGTLTVLGATISHNTGDGGAAIYNYLGTLYIAHSSLTNNVGVTGGPTAGVANHSGTATIADSTITASDGGGLSNTGTARVITSTLSDNVGTYGGIYNVGTLRVFASTISGNQPDVHPLNPGGGIENLNAAWITDSTIAGNTAYQGGGIDNGGKMTLLWSTLPNNHADSGGGDDIYVAGTTSESTKLTMKANIFAGSSSDDCAFTPHEVFDQGYDLADDASCALNPKRHSINSQQTGLDPNGLQNNGGPTQTIALLPTSVAVDYAPTAIGPPVRDQRLLPRPDAGEGLADLGAYELQDS